MFSSLIVQVNVLRIPELSRDQDKEQDLGFAWDTRRCHHLPHLAAESRCLQEEGQAHPGSILVGVKDVQSPYPWKLPFLLDPREEDIPNPGVRCQIR